MSSYRNLHLILFVFFTIALVSFLLGLYFRTINGDEVILAEQVLSLQKLGFVKAELFDGMGKGWEIRQYHYHKLFILLGVLFSSIFDFNIWILRVIPLLFFIGMVVLLFKYLQIKNLQTNLIFAIILLVLLVNFTVFEFAFLFRPEIIVSALGLLSFILLHQFIQNGNNWLCIGSGAIAGLAAFTHLNGISYIMAGGLLLLILSKWKHAFLFGIPAGLITLLYFYDLNNLAELNAFWQQFQTDPNLGENDFKIIHAFLKIVNEHMRFFWNPPTAAFSLLYLVCLISNFSYFKKEHSTLLWYHLILIGCLSAIAQSKTIKYGLIYYPFMVLIISISLNRVFTKHNFKTKSWLQMSVLALYFFMNFGYAIWYMTGDSTSHLIAKNNIYADYMPKKEAKVLANGSFYFNSYKNYTVHLILAYELLHEIYLKTPTSKEGFYKFAKEQNNDYILLRNHKFHSNMLSLLDFDELQNGAINHGYRVIFKNNEVVIMERVMDNGLINSSGI